MSEVKRMRYFKEEFLKNEDFTDEQEYHRQMRYRHNQDFHTWGIGDGLEVTFTPGDHSVDISPGIAIDGEGKEIVLGKSRILDFNEAGYEGGKSYYITITWSQEEGEPRQENEAKRWVETPEINTSETLPAQPELALVLALVTLNPDRTIAAVDDSIRRYSQVGIPDGSVTEAKLADNAVTSAKIKDGSVRTSTLVDKAVTRAKIGDGSVNEDKLSTSVQAKLVTNGDAHTHSAQDVGALPKTGGTIDGNLQVKGDVNITNVIDFGDTTDWNDHWRFTHQWITPGDLVIDRRVAGTYVGPYLTITTSGRVGIGPGAGTPEETLHVNGSVRGNQQGGALRINTTNGYVDIGSQDQNNTHFMTDRETFYFNKRIMVDGGEIGSSSEQDMKLQTGGETRVTIKQDNGNVGIGTINPNEKLTVEGAISLKEQDISPSAEKGYGKIYAKEHTLFCTKFNGVDYYVSMSSLNKNNIADFTISLWFKMNAHNPKGRSYLLDLRGDGSEVRMAGGLIIDDAGGGNSYLEHYWCWASGGYSEFRENIGNITGSWHHTVLVREGNVLREYLDGTLISDNPTQGSSVLPKDDLVTFDNEWRIGTSASQNTAGDNYWFNGFIDEVSIWDRALSTEEISSIFIGSRSIDLTQVYSSNLIGYWRMGDGDTFPTIEDHSGNNNNGTVQSGEFDSTTVRALYYKDSHGNELPLSGVKGVGGGISSLWSQMGSNIYYDRGNVGIGTTDPQKWLHIRGANGGPVQDDGQDRPALAITGSFPELDLFSATDNQVHGPTIRLGSYNDHTQTGFKHWCIGTSGRNSRFLDIGFSNNQPPVYAGLRNHNGRTVLTLLENGYVGIGTQEPSQPFHVINQNQTPCLLESTGPANRLQLTTIEGPAHRVEFCNIGEGRAAISVTGFGNAITVTQVGNVGIKTENPAYTLHTNGISYATFREGGGFDYAEYFESKHGKEIKPGTSVVLDGDKIRPARKGEHPFGIISANPLIAGGVPIEWPKKYLRDEFGNQIMEEYKEEIMAPKKEKVKRERQKMKKKKVKETITKTEIAFEDGKYFQKEIKETVEKEIEETVFKEVDLYDMQKKNVISKHRIPVMETYEEEVDVLDEEGQAVLVGSGKFETKTRPKINPEYDETKEYIPREKRPEWNCVGLLGQLPLRKGQPVAPTWVKIKDLAKDVELWLVK